MTSPRTRILTPLVALATTAALVTGPPASSTPSATPAGVVTAALPDPLRDVLDQLVAQGASGAIALVDRGRRTRAVAAGQARLQPPLALRPRAKVRVGSITKSFVAALTLRLVADGRISLDDRVRKYLPRLLPRRQARRITLRMLLGHTSGLREYADASFAAELVADPGRTWKPAALVRRVADRSLLFRPGTDFFYSNTGYVVAGMMIERATGRSLAGLLRRRVFRPLGLSKTSFPSRPRIRGYHARGYLPASLTGGTPLDVTRISPSAYGAAGAVVSTVVEVRRFYRAVLSGRLLPRPQLREMLTMTRIGPGQSYGLGLLRLDLPCGRVWGHNGQVPGYVAFALETRRGRRAAVVSVPTTPDEAINAGYQEAVGLAVCHMVGRTPPARSSAGLVPDLGGWSVVTR